MQKKIQTILFSALCLTFVALCISIYAKYSVADSVGQSVAIPPMIEGVEPSEHLLAQDLEKQDVILALASGEKLTISVEIADEEQERRTGMMYRTKVPEKTGMLFVFDEEDERAFWMKNTLVSLDLLFIRGDGVISHIAPQAEPQSMSRIPSNGKVLAVLELAGGEASRLGVNVGDRVMHDIFEAFRAEQNDSADYIEPAAE